MPTGLPNVSIEILNNQLGRVTPVPDRVMGLIMTGVATTEIPLLTPKVVYSLAEAEDLLLTEAYDTTNEIPVHRMIKEFYLAAGTGAELWIMLVSKATVSMSTLWAEGFAGKIIDESNGRVNVLGYSRALNTAETVDVTKGFDLVSWNAGVNAQALAEAYALKMKPFRVIIAANYAEDVDAAPLDDQRARSLNRVSYMVGGIDVDSNFASIGYTLGKLAAIPPQRNIGRVKDGPVTATSIHYPGYTLEALETYLNSIHDKGYITFRTFPNKTGYFYNDDPTACPLSDDYSSLARGRVIDKAHRIAYATFVEEIQDDIEIDANGYMNPAIVGDYKAKIENAIELAMANEISGVRCDIDPAQNVLSTDQVKITKLAIRPRGYAKYIDVPLGYENPAV